MNPPRTLALALGCLAALAAALPAAPIAAQDARRTVTIVPALGAGVVRSNGSWNSAGVEAALDVGFRLASWRLDGYASVRGIGVGCSEACFEGGPALAAGVSRLLGGRPLGGVWLGAAAGAMHQHGRWRFVPQGRVTLDRARVRVELRVELPQQEGSGVYVPLLVGIPIG